MPFLYPILFISLFLLAGCSGGNRASLNSADAVMEEAPDSALNILRGIEPEKLSDRELPYYALLMTQALVKNDIPVASDSLISLAYSKYNDDWYGDRGMRSNFYMGEVLFNQEKSRDAIKYYLTAYEDAKRLKNDYWRAKTAERIADLFFRVYNYDEAAKYRKEAILYYGKTGRIVSQRIAVADLSAGYLNESKYKEALAIIDSIYSRTSEDMPDETFLMDYIRGVRINALIASDRSDDIDSTVYNLIKSNSGDLRDAETYIIRNQINFYRDRVTCKNKSDSIFKKIRADSNEEKWQLLYSHYQKAKEEGDLSSTVEWFDSLVHHNGAVAMGTVRQSTTGAESDFYVDLTIRNKRKSQFYFMLCISIFVLALAIWVIYRLKNRAYKSEIEARVDSIVRLKVNTEKLAMERTMLREEIKEKSDSLAELRKNVDQKTDTIYFLEHRIINEKNTNGILENNLEETDKALNTLNLSLDDQGKLIKRLETEIDRMEEEIRERSRNIEILKRNLDAKSSDIMSKNVVMENLFRERWTTLNMLCNEYYEKGDSPVLREKIIGSIEKELKKIGSKKSIEQIEEAVNKYCDGILDDLKRECPNLTERDVTLATLIMAGFSVKAISYLLGIKTGNLYVIRRRLIERISKSNAPDKDRIIEKLR